VTNCKSGILGLLFIYQCTDAVGMTNFAQNRLQNMSLQCNIQIRDYGNMLSRWTRIYTNSALAAFSKHHLTSTLCNVLGLLLVTLIHSAKNNIVS
jgi:hypothetical protein